MYRKRDILCRIVFSVLVCNSQLEFTVYSRLENNDTSTKPALANHLTWPDQSRSKKLTFRTGA